MKQSFLMIVKREIEITPKSVVLDGKAIEVNEVGDKMLVELYRRFAGNYPKFFKMDTLSRLGFIAAEMLQPRVDAVILANRSASIKNDRDYLETITNGNYYPSPALFVYTLPNIVTGEIAIRHNIQGETACYILENPEELEPILRSTPFTTALAGWCECSGPIEYYAKIQIIWKN